MKPKNLIGKPIFTLLSVGLFLAFTASMMAQVETVETTTTAGKTTKQVNVENAEVIHVSPSDLVVRMENGEIRHFANVPETTKVDVEGKMLGIHELKPGMKLQRTITTTTTPKMITKVEKVSGTIFAVNPPNRVILTMENGKNHEFWAPSGQKFDIQGEGMMEINHLRRGMKLTATTVTEIPETRVAMQSMLSGKMPPPPPPPPETAILIEEEPAPEPQPAPAPETTVAEATPESLPQTGSNLPLIGLLGVLMLSLGFGLRVIRTDR
ncbi:MAG: LPXTG cell wall anchor domain-containing protein [Acidobacteriota bacterium]